MKDQEGIKQASCVQHQQNIQLAGIYSHSHRGSQRQHFHLDSLGRIARIVGYEAVISQPSRLVHVPMMQPMQV